MLIVLFVGCYIAERKLEAEQIEVLSNMLYFVPFALLLAGYWTFRSHNERPTQIVSYCRWFPGFSETIRVRFPLFAAIAYSASYRCYGYSQECIDQQSAENEAIRQCNEEIRQRNSTNSEIRSVYDDPMIVIWTNEWCALAIAEDRSYGAGSAWTGFGAKAEALRIRPSITSRSPACP
jgi:hypothetical protein